MAHSPEINAGTVDTDCRHRSRKFSEAEKLIHDPVSSVPILTPKSVDFFFFFFFLAFLAKTFLPKTAWFWKNCWIQGELGPVVTLRPGLGGWNTADSSQCLNGLLLRHKINFVHFIVSGTDAYGASTLTCVKIAFSQDAKPRATNSRILCKSIALP